MEDKTHIYTKKLENHVRKKAYPEKISSRQRVNSPKYI